MLITPAKKHLFFLEKSENYICNDKLCQKFVPLTQFLNNHLKKNLIRLITPAKKHLFFLEKSENYICNNESCQKICTFNTISK